MIAQVNSSNTAPDAARVQEHAESEVQALSPGLRRVLLRGLTAAGWTLNQGARDVEEPGAGAGDGNGGAHAKDGALAAEGNRGFRRKYARGNPAAASFLKYFSRGMRLTAWATTAAMLHMTFATTPGFDGAFSTSLFAQPAFQDFEQGSKNDANRFVDRARRLNDADAWNNYVQLGIASEFIEWEEDALEQVRQEFQNIDEDENLDEDQKEFEKDLIRASYDAAVVQWEADAEDYIFTERGEYRAESAEVTIDPITEAEYAAIVADAQAAMNAQQQLDLVGWDAAVDAGRTALEQRFEDSLQNELTRIRGENAGLSGDELAAFEAALNAKEAEVRAEFELRDNFYVLSARNSYAAEKRADDVSARLFADQQSAENQGDALINDAAAALESETTDLIDQANSDLNELSDVPDFDPALLDELSGDWESKMEAVVDAGLRRWEETEEQLYSQRLVWLNETKRTRAEGEAIWKSNHEKLKAAREKWLADLQDKVTEGREEWQVKFAEFADSRLRAEQELQLYIQEEQMRRDAALAQLGDMVRGGGAALLEAKDGYNYYNNLVNTLPASACPADPSNRDASLYCFYVQQRDEMGDSLGRFQTILGGVEGVMRDNMHGAGNATGFLNDRRVYAGTLPAQVEAIGTGDYRSDLEALMQAQSEDFLLYQRDINTLIDRNAVFTTRVDELQAGGFDYNGAVSIADLTDLIQGLDGKYDDHIRELSEIVGEDRSALPDDAARLAAIKTDIGTWFSDSSDENVRLKRETVNYFKDGLGGYFLSGNENDPYLMTQAEYEWELLRRERNYLAKRLHRAEAVKRYAELAEQFEAGLELAQVTAERTDVAEQRSDLRELSYMLIKGDLAIDNRAKTDDPLYDPAIRDAEYTRLLSERGIDLNFLNAREADLAAESALLNSIAALANPGVGDLNTAVADIDAFLTAMQAPPAVVAADQQATHRLTILRDKLLTYRDRVQAGEDPAVLANRWATIGGGAGGVRDEVEQLIADYDFNDLRDELDRVRLAVSEPTVAEYQAELYTIRADMEANADDLEIAREDVEIARERYRAALIDFEVLRAGNSDELIRIDVMNTTRQLTPVMNYMQELETIPGFDTERYSVVEGARIEHLYQISEQERATRDLQQTQNILRFVQGLEDAKARLQSLDDFLGGTDLNALDPIARADAVIAEEANLTNTVAADPVLRSHEGAVQAFASLTGARTSYETKTQELSDAIADGDPLATIEELRKQQSDAALLIDRSIELIAAGIRGEEAARRTAVHDLLGTAPANRDAILNQWNSEQEDLASRAYDRGADAAAAIDAFLNTHREKSYGELLQLANTQVAAAQSARSLNLTKNGYGLDAAPANDQLEIAEALRSFIAGNRTAIDAVNAAPESGDFDQRTVADKWTAYLENVGKLVDDADFFEQFQNAIPDSANHAWVVAYRGDRTGLQGRLNAVLAETNGNLQAAYAALAADDRGVLGTYFLGGDAASAGGASIPTGSAVELREALQQIGESLETDLAATYGDFRGIYLRETAYAQQLELNEAGAEYNELNQRLAAAQGERSDLMEYRDELASERDALDPVADAARILELQGQIDDIEVRIAVLDARVTTIEADIVAPEARYRQAMNTLQEINSTASTAPLLTELSAGLIGDSNGLQLLQWTVQLLGEQQTQSEATRDTSAADQVKAVIGFYQTDTNGEILRDGGGDALVSAEFAALGYTDPAMDLGAALSGSQTGPNLERWSQRLLDWLRETEDRAGATAGGAAGGETQIDPEVIAAIRQLERGIMDLLAARRMIDNRSADMATLEAQARAQAEEYSTSTSKLAQLIRFESELQNAIDQALGTNADPVEAALSYIEKKENRQILRLFAGYNMNGELDGVANVEIQARVAELLTLADRLRAARVDAVTTGIAGQYATALEDYLTVFSVDPTLQPPDAQAYVAAFPEIAGTAVVDAVNNTIADADFRANLWTWIDQNPGAARLYRSEAISVLHASINEGAALQAELQTRLANLQTNIDNNLSVLMAEPEQLLSAARDREVTTTVADFLTSYSTRADDARAAYLDDIAGISDAENLAVAQGQLLAAAESELSGAVFNEIRLELRKRIQAGAVTTADLKSELTNYLNGLANPTATIALEDDLYARSLRSAVITAQYADSYEAADYPAALREIVLVREYQAANARYDAYLARKNSDVASERSAATLDLRGLLGDTARYIAVRDFTDYLAANDFAAYIAGAEQNGGRGVDTYIAQYMVDRGTSPELLGAGYAELYERLAQMEYQRLGVTPLSNAHALDESQFAGEFRPTIVLAYIQDYIARNGVSFAGATVADRQTEFEAVFESVLDDAAYAHGGESLRQRLLAKSQLEAFELLTFNAIENGTAIEEYLPAYLDQLRTDGELDNAPQGANEYLPDDLTNIAGYQTADHKAMAAALDARYATELGRLDVLLAANAGNGTASGLFLSDAEAEAVLNRAGYSATGGAERATLLNMIRANHSAGVLASQGQTVAPLNVLRQDRVLRELLPNAADRQALNNFYAGQGERFEKVENAFFTELADGELQTIAKENRGEFLAALASRSQGGTPALYAGMSPEQQTAFDQLQTSLWAELGATDSAALVASIADYEIAFDTRSAQELAASGIFDAFEAGAFAYLNRTANDTQLTAARQNRNGVMRAYLEALQVEAGVLGGLSAESTTLLAGIPGLQGLLETAAEQANPGTRELAEKEAVLIDRYLTQLMETDAERNYIDEILTDPALLDPFQSKGPTYGVSIRAAENQAVMQELTQALVGTVADHSRYLRNKEREYARERELTNRLKDFANSVGDDLLASRFAHYRTYMGTERTYQNQDHATHLANSGTKNFDEFNNGQILAADSLGLDPNTLFDNINWEEQLLTDDRAIGGSVDLGTDTANTDDDITVDYKLIRTVADAANRNHADYAQELEYTFKEHLANNYLEAASNLNAAFANIFNATQMADARRATPPDERIAQQLTGYNADAAAGVNDLTVIQAIEQDATARIAAHGQIQIGEKQQQIEQGLATVTRSGEQFADAGRRNQIRTIGQMAYLDSVMRPIADEYELAQTTLGDLSDTEAALRTRYATANQNHVNALNEQASRYRNYQAANNEYEMRRSIQDYAETPYLINDGEDENATIEDWANNAREEYRRAVLVLEQANNSLQTAAYNVQTQDNLTEFYAIVTGLENNETYPPLGATERDRLLELRDRKFTNNETLTAAEETELTELTHREMYERYADVITARSEHIKHTMRMVRIHKAEEIIDAEMQRRQSVLEEKKQQFYAKLDGVFQVNAAQRANPDVMAARDAVYMRMAAQAEGGNFNYLNEFRSWFWGAGAWAGSMGQAAYGAALGGTQVQVTPGQVAEAAAGQLGAALMPASDQNAIGLWLGTGGNLAAFSGFQGVYTGYLMTIMAHDLDLIRNVITQTLMTTVMATGVALVGAASALQATLMSNPYTAAYAMPIVQTMRAAGMAQITYAQSQMIISQAQYMMALFSMIFMGAATFNSGFMPQIYDVMAKQGEYEDAQAAVDYFSKVPDMETMKERMVQWGAQHGDNDSANNLYDLTDEDLKYLFDRDTNGDAVYQTQTGATQTLTAEEQNESLDVDGFKDQVTYKDAFGRRYDPSTLTSTAGPRDGNAYIIGGQRYTRIRQMQNNGGTVYLYARIIDDSAPVQDAYNMGSIMDMLVQHGTDLREDRKQRYLAAGTAATNDTTFLYQERDDTYENLYADATSQDAGGREYSGYRVTHADYVENQSDVFNSELQQRVAVQNKEWDLREQELQDRYEEWERKMDLLLARGRSSWGNAENRFLQEWREWERKIDNDEAAGNKKWDDQIAEHFTKKEQWEEDVRDRASEENLTAVLTESVNELNNQIAIANQNMGANMASVSTTAYVTQILAGLENDKPSFTEKFQKINSNIKDFKTRLSVSELTGANLGAAITGVDANYREALRIHGKNLKVLANVKVFEEYRKLFDGFAAQLEDQNAIIDQQTQSAAFNAGFVRSGAFFIKSGNISDALGVVNAYEYFDTAGVLREELAKSGFNEMDGGELTSYLAGKDDVEVEAYFHVQKLALQRVYEVLMGKGTQEERRESQDEQIIGRFGTWAGRAPGGSNGEANLASNAVQAAKIDLQDGGNALNALKYLGFAGFGEQGVMGVRPGGAPLGFYPQLELAGMLTGRGDNSAIANAADPGAAFGPFQNTLIADMGVMASTFINQYNVPLMLMNSYKNVELASKVHGKDSGYMWEAQAINLLKAPLAATGGVVTGAGVTAVLGGNPLGLLVMAAGVGITTLANSIQVNPTTGERITKLTDQAAVETAAMTITAMVGGAQAGKGAMAIFSGISSAAKAGVRYDADGRSQGMNFAGNQGTSALLAGLGGAAGSYAGASSGIGGFAGALGGDGISTAIGVATEYGKYKAWGADQSGFMGMYNVDGGRLGAIGGMALSSAMNEGIAKHKAKQKEMEMNRIYMDSQDLDDAQTQMVAAGLWADPEVRAAHERTRNNHNQRQMVDIFRALGVRRRETEAGGTMEDVSSGRVANVLQEMLRSQGQDVSRSQIISELGGEGQMIPLNDVGAAFQALGGNFESKINFQAVQSRAIDKIVNHNKVSGSQGQVHKIVYHAAIMRVMDYEKQHGQLSNQQRESMVKQEYKTGLSQTDIKAVATEARRKRTQLLQKYKKGETFEVDGTMVTVSNVTETEIQLRSADGRQVVPISIDPEHLTARAMGQMGRDGRAGIDFVGANNSEQSHFAGVSNSMYQDRPRIDFQAKAIADQQLQKYYNSRRADALQQRYAEQVFGWDDFQRVYKQGSRMGFVEGFGAGVFGTGYNPTVNYGGTNQSAGMTWDQKYIYDSRHRGAYESGYAGSYNAGRAWGGTVSPLIEMASMLPIGSAVLGAAKLAARAAATQVSRAMTSRVATKIVGSRARHGLFSSMRRGLGFSSGKGLNHGNFSALRNGGSVELGVDPRVLQAPQDKLLQGFFQKIWKAENKKRTLGSIDSEALKYKARNGMEVEHWPNSRQMDVLAKHTGVEWARYNKGGKKYIQSGTKNSVAWDFDKYTTHMSHTHFHTARPSTQDYMAWRIANAQGAKINTLDIIYRGRMRRWDMKRIEVARRLNIITKF